MWPFRLPRVFSLWWWMRRIAFVMVALYVGSAFLAVQGASTRDDRRPAQAIVVLGAAQYNGRPSPVLRARLDHALGLYTAKMAPLIIVTGGRQVGDRTTEASTGAEYLIKKGVPEKRIRREVQGKDSYESLRAARRFLSKEGVTDVLIVTDGYHAARATETATEVGLVAHASPVPDSAPLDRVITESMAVAVGRMITYRRLASLNN
jgi:uncharacterized SAM-binding protein YcdF (DUF218 family)